MVFDNPLPSERLSVSRKDPQQPLSSYSPQPIELEGQEWPTAEHYYQAMKFTDEAYRETVRNAPQPTEAARLGKSRRHGRRRDWDKLRETYMTRALYIKCRSYPEVAAALLASGEQVIVENSQYDYYWGCGRDQRGHNTYGKVLMAIRDKLRQEGGEQG